MQDKISDECSVAALYGCDMHHTRMENLYIHIVEWCESIGFQIDKLAVEGEGFSPNVSSFSRVNSRLQSNGFASVRGFSLYCLIPDGDVPLNDWCITAEVSWEKSYCIIGARTSVATLPCTGAEATDGLRGHSSLLPITLAAIGDLDPTYGIGFRRDIRLGPSLYAAGICQGLQPFGDERTEVRKINSWGKVGLKERIYNAGTLRGIYPCNFLTELQLHRDVGGRTLAEWISQESRHGTLSSATGRMVRWTVEETEIPQVRSELHSAGFIFDVT